MSTVEAIVLAIVGSSAFTALVTALLNRRKNNADITHTITDAAQDAVTLACKSYDLQIAELKNRLAQTEARLAQAESRAAEAEKRAIEFRSELIKVGTMLDQSRRELEKLALVIQQLFEQVEKLGGKPEVDPEVLKRITALSQRNHD